MGVFKNEVGRPTKKVLIVRTILKIVAFVLVAGIGYYIGDQIGKKIFDNKNNQSTNVIVTTTTTTSSKSTDDKICLSEQELSKLIKALSNYYTSKNGTPPPHIGTSNECVDEDGVITIRIYEDHEDYVVTLESYDVDPTTYLARDSVFLNEIDLNEFK